MYNPVVYIAIVRVDLGWKVGRGGSLDCTFTSSSEPYLGGRS